MNTPPPPPSNESNWFYVDTKNEPQGPHTLDELRQLKQIGTISRETFVIREGQSEWEPYVVATAFVEESFTLHSAKSEKAPISSNIQEYRRTCRLCGKVWHSLVEREKAVSADIKGSTCKYCMCNPEVSVQVDRNIAAQKSEISRLKTCPECHSANYDEEMVTHRT